MMRWVNLAWLVVAATCWLVSEPLRAESGWEKLLAEPILEAEDARGEVKAFCKSRVAVMPKVASLPAWEAEAERIRKEVLAKVVLRGQGEGWRDARLEVHWDATLEAGDGYRIRKLRFEALPGLWIPALLYEPDNLQGKVPVVMNVNGHDRVGKAATYKQTRCINQAKRGMLALNVEWLGMGQLNAGNFGHYRMNQLDLCGTSGLAPFYLSMKRGLDVLLAHPHADPQRVAVAGLSGGGWQTIVISALDTRVTLTNPVAGYSSFVTRVEQSKDLGDSEQTPVDLAGIADYTHLTALLAPRPALLTFNKTDNCCFESDHALPPLLAAAKPIYELYGHTEHLRSHVNVDPGTHNFGEDNRQALYQMLADHFAGESKAARSADEIECKSELLTAEQLRVPLPPENADFQSLATRLMQPLPRNPGLPDPKALTTWQDSARARLSNVVQAPRYEVRDEPVLLDERKQDEVVVRRWKLPLGKTWTVPVVELIPADDEGLVLLLCDQGMAQAGSQIQSQLALKRRVVAVDPFYLGHSKIAGRDFLYALLVSSVGQRPLGIQAAQVAAVARWLHDDRELPLPRVYASGPRTSLIALVAGGLEPKAIAGMQLNGSFSSLKQIIETNRSVNSEPELFCFGLLEQFDVLQLAALQLPRPIVFTSVDDRMRRELAPLSRLYKQLDTRHEPLQGN